MFSDLDGLYCGGDGLAVDLIDLDKDSVDFWSLFCDEDNIVGDEDYFLELVGDLLEVGLLDLNCDGDLVDLLGLLGGLVVDEHELGLLDG